MNIHSHPKKILFDLCEAQAFIWIKSYWAIWYEGIWYQYIQLANIFQKKISVCTWQELCLPISSLPLLCSLCLFCSHCFFSQQYCSSMPGIFNFSGLHFSNWKILSCPFFNHRAHTDSLYSGLGEGGLAEIRKTLWIEEVLKLKLCLLGRKVAVLKIQWALRNKVGLPIAMYGENYVLTMGQVLCKEFYILHLI